MAINLGICFNKFHNEDGPAIIHSYGKKEYWVDGEFIKDED